MHIELNCIPPLHRVQKIDLPKIKSEASKEKEITKPEVQNAEKDEDDSDFVAEFDLLPLWNTQRRNYQLRKLFDFKSNPYWKSKWDCFKEHIPRKPLILKVFPVEKIKVVKKPVYRMSLNGKYYGKNSRVLNPIPTK